MKKEYSSREPFQVHSLPGGATNLCRQGVCL
ncbi:hypothetical protein CFP56_002767 [Quercus suber]|uniref:Uncharacterized protein n=1 Tax=Quercus suber TaxID=58331 RepID=A0AAW0LF88_QUESU